MPVTLGLALPQRKHFHLYRDVPMVARTAEEIGYESLWVFERPLFPPADTRGLYRVSGLPWPDNQHSAAHPLTLLAPAAAATRRVRIGGVLVAPLHDPSQLARSLASLDNASGGRLVAGFGTGWSHDDYAAASVAPFETGGAVLDELLDVCAAAWGPDPASYRGRPPAVDLFEVGPQPARPIPVYLPASSPAASRRLVDRADGWITVASGAGQLATEWRKVQDLAAERGRKRPIRTCVRVNAAYSAKPFVGEGRQPFQGSIGQMIEDLAASAHIDGITEFLIDLQSSTRDAQELTDVALEFYTAARAAEL